MKNIPQLSYNEIFLRGFQRADKNQYVSVLQMNREWLAPWLTTHPKGSFERKIKFKKNFNAYKKEAKRLTCLNFGIFYKNYFVGHIVLGGIFFSSSQSAHIGYWVAQRYTCRGIATISCALVCDYAFSILDLHRIEISICFNNEISKKIPQKLGFRNEGIRRKYLHVNGKWEDHVTYALTKEEARLPLIDVVG